MPSSNNKIKYNLKNAHYAVQTYNATTDAYTYATPVALPGAVSLSLSPEGEAVSFYADGIEYFRAEGNDGYSGDLELALIPESFRTDVLGEVLDSNNVLAESFTGAELVRFALLFQFDGDVKAIPHVMYNCCVTSRPEISSQTKEDSVSPVTETLSIECKPRTDGLVKCRGGNGITDATVEAWFESVYVPATTSGGGGGN